MKAYPVIVTLAAISLAACTSGQPPSRLASNMIHRQQVATTTKHIYPPKNPQQIAIYSNKQRLQAPYRIIGVATVSKFNLMGKKRHEETLHKMMKNLAASIGGDALINVQITKENVQANIIQFRRILL